MNNFFTKFYSTYIKNIHDFLNSNTDILYINGYSGSGKSSVLKNTLKNFDKDILIFPHLCFEGTSINDFLLSFYDAFRNYAIKGKITLVNNPEEAFIQKVSYYFKKLDYPFIIVVDNYELVSGNSEITDFLLHVAGFDNVKVILVSKNPNSEIAENPTVSVDRLIFEKIDFQNFNTVLKEAFPNLDDNTIKEFYEAADGYELYIRMTLAYVEAGGATIEELMEEYKLKKREYFDFILEKQISLIPNNYYSILNHLAYINHNISVKLINTYSLGDEKELPYLISKHAVSEFFETYYIKSYLRRYFSENINLQDKVDIYSKIISIYESEIEKSLKERILRLSRETIRGQLEILKRNMPKVQKVNSNPAFSYMAQAITGNPKWFVTDTKKRMSGLDELRKKRDERRELKKQEIKLTDDNQAKFDDLLSEAKNLEDEHKYNETIEVLNKAKAFVKDFNQKAEILLRISNVYEKTGDKNSALNILRELIAEAGEKQSYDIYAKCKINAGKIFKKMYAFSRAKASYEDVISKSSSVSNEVLSQTKALLGEIYELESNFNGAIKEYKDSINLMLKEEENAEFLSETYLKLASLYDENEEYENAYYEYHNAIENAKKINNNKILIKAYMNSGIISSYLGNSDEAVTVLKKAYDIAKKEENELDLYYISRNIASIYMNTEPEKAYEYLTEALEYARSSDNSFETAISLLELGDYYYNERQNEQALICYFQAKGILGDAASKENLDRINSRINDMKIKLGDYIFNGMKALYDQA